MSNLLEKKPIRAWLKERETLLPRPKFADMLNLLQFSESKHVAIPLPPGVSPREAVDLVAETSWAKNLAAGVCSKLAGLTGTAYDRCVVNASKKVAMGLLGVTPEEYAAGKPARRRR